MDAKISLKVKVPEGVSAEEFEAWVKYQAGLFPLPEGNPMEDASFGEIIYPQTLKIEVR